MIKNKIVKLLSSAFLLTFILSFTSCSDLIYDGEETCPTWVKFVFTKNRQALRTINGVGADAFSNSVTSVHLFVIDTESGELVFSKTEQTKNLKDHCMMPVDLQPGKYTFIAWCGLDANDENNAYILQHNYTTRATGDNCHLKMAATGEPVHDEQYDAVYQGTTHVRLAEQGEMVEIELTKNTNDIAVWIQHPYASLADGDYEVVYQDANGTMDFTTNMVTSEDEMLTYKAHTKELLNTSTEYNGERLESGAMIAHLSVNRLMATHADNARIVIRAKDGTEVFAIPFIKYLLEMQTFTKAGTNKNQQWYLDCEDTYYCSFYFTGYDQTWTPVRIIVNNWVKVPDQDETVTGGE
ncbi:MAG: FimB/Mfa2 family fimbrial subunit [Prevotellaceae bacterium]|nr:FimB/Mfa2 family fimbrial subunit [Prevotellaceae bacterium]